MRHLWRKGKVSLGDIIDSIASVEEEVEGRSGVEGDEGVLGTMEVLVRILEV